MGWCGVRAPPGDGQVPVTTEVKHGEGSLRACPESLPQGDFLEQHVTVHTSVTGAGTSPVLHLVLPYSRYGTVGRS